MKNFLSDIKYLFKVHLLGLLVLSIYRIWLYAVAHDFLAEASKGEIGLQAGAFLRGVWFDNVIACYILIIPLTIIVSAHVFGKYPKWRLKLAWGWFFLFYAIAFAASATDISYFLYFFKHLNSGIWNWAEYGTTTVGMVLGETSYYPRIAGYFILTGIFAWLTFPTDQKGKSGKSRSKADIKIKTGIGNRLVILTIGAALIGLCLFGIRGRRGYNPIKVSAAYYCQDPFLNQLGINPTFNLLLTTLDDRRPENKELRLMDIEKARKNAESHLGRPLSYTFKPTKPLLSDKPNVVLILMESMSYDLMHSGQTPFLDSLSTKSIRFENCYSAGSHTNHGIFSTLYSFPALMFRNLMKGSNIPKYDGLPTVLKENGYKTMFFMTHESQYDNMNAFLRTNGFEEIYAQENYPSDKVANSFGVQDDYLFEYAINRLNQTKAPFFATLLTISNHPPYIIPDWFHPRSNRPEEQIVEYSDHALRLFFTEAKKQPWYKNTLFVLLGDHGKLCGNSENEMPRSMNHVPWIIHSPHIAQKAVDAWTMQTDVQPTILGLIGITARQENFGQDILNKPRPMAYYTADNVMGARTSDHLYIYEPSTQSEWFYNTPAGTRDTYCSSLSDPKEKAVFKRMKDYLFSMLQTAQEEIKKHE